MNEFELANELAASFEQFAVLHEKNIIKRIVVNNFFKIELFRCNGNLKTNNPIENSKYRIAIFTPDKPGGLVVAAGNELSLLQEQFIDWFITCHLPNIKFIWDVIRCEYVKVNKKT